MTDVHSKETRSYNMSRIRSKDTAPEIVIRKFLFANGFRFRLHQKSLPGKPDIVLKRYKTVIFVHGCFWHGHKSCKYFVVPKTKTEWWLNKINGNIQNDEKAMDLLRTAGWNTIIVWECDLKKDKKDSILNDILRRIRNNE
jgi:DNA mismatch endonuclease (patch repair protein)